MNQNQRQQIQTLSILPGPDGWTPAPDLLTEAEAVRFLRLDTPGGPANPSRTLNYYLDRGQLRPTRLGRRNYYLRSELLEFLHRQTDR